MENVHKVRRDTIMGKLLTLLFILLLAVGSMGGYLYVTDEIIAGKQKIAAGQKELEQGQQMLTKGKVKLASGKQQLSKGKDVYNGMKVVSVLGVATLPVSWVVLSATNSKLSEGDQMVAKGNEKVQAGEKQLNEGKLQLHRGIERLNQANWIRIACATGAIFFTSLLIVLGFCWRRSLSTILRRVNRRN